MRNDGTGIHGVPAVSVGRREGFVFGKVDRKMMKMKMPLRCGDTDTGEEKKTYHQYTEEFTESKAERTWHRDMRMLTGAVIVVIILALLGVI